uniref:Uncharacterized protein n=1 Tax=Arundo donax TaxID=35708 RepID=A0A0A8YIB6_ARUDO
MQLLHQQAVLNTSILPFLENTLEVAIYPRTSFK